jgi:transcriptional regulator with XRE-family HTH domain
MEASVEQGIAWQIRANRQSRGLTQAQLATEMNTTQSAISRLEDPEYGCHSLESLTKIAHIFDCALSVRLISYAQLAKDSEDLSMASMEVNSFNKDLMCIEGGSNVSKIGQ